jgi:Mor family transcriptional regulator
MAARLRKITKRLGRPVTNAKRDVRIYRKYAKGLSIVDLSNEYRLSRQRIFQIVLRMRDKFRDYGSL